VLGCPWIRLWRSLPLDSRRWLARGLSHGRRTAWLRALSRMLGGPVASFVLFSVVLLSWHLPFMFDATLKSTTLHAFEHTLFFTTALMFWKQAIPSPPLHTSLVSAHRVVFCIGGMIVSWVLAVVLALAPHPLYSFYAHEASRPGGISALADQQLAAGIMWVPGSVTFLIVMIVYVHRWLAPDSAGSARSPRLASEH
jgi:cytochrome c oxidase assembly factor CtaG